MSPEQMLGSFALGFFGFFLTFAVVAAVMVLWGGKIVKWIVDRIEKQMEDK